MFNPEKRPTPKSEPRASKRPRAEAEPSQSIGGLIKSIIHNQSKRFDPRDPEAPEAIREMIDRWEHVEQTINNPDRDAGTAIATIQTALQDAERRKTVVRDRYAPQEIEQLNQLLTALERRGAA